MNGKRCENCSMRAYYDRKPDSILGRVWKWHTFVVSGMESLFPVASGRPENYGHEQIRQPGKLRSGNFSK